MYLPRHSARRWSGCGHGGSIPPCSGGAGYRPEKHLLVHAGFGKNCLALRWFLPTINLSDPRSGEALTGVDVTVGADMPSMPMAHNVKPAKAMPGNEPGTYRAHIKLEMHGDWVVKLDLAGPVRDRIVKSMRFEPKP